MLFREFEELTDENKLESSMCAKQAFQRRRPYSMIRCLQLLAPGLDHESNLQDIVPSTVIWRSHRSSFTVLINCVIAGK